jgi:hypothetical protein
MQPGGLALGGWTESRVISVVVGGVAAVAIAASAWIYAAHLPPYSEGPIRSDGVGYYVYLPAVFLDHDLTLKRTGKRSFGGDPAYIPGVNWVRTAVPVGRPGQHEPLDQFGVGEAVLMAPFFAAGDALAAITHERRDGFSWPYQAAAAASGLVYVLLGLIVTATVLRRWFGRRTVVVTTLAIAFGAAVVEYATYDVSFSHGYSFFLIAVVLRLTLSVWKRPRPLTAAALGGSVGLVGLVRLTNLDILVFCALVGIQRRADLAERLRALRRHLDLLALGTGAFLLALLPQLGYWYDITKQLLVNQYEATGAHLNLLQPHLIGVLFSVRKGLFFWTPLLLLAVAGLPLLRRRAPPVAVPAVAYLVTTTWVVASWSIWWYGGSFGMRALIDAMPVFALGLAALVETAQSPAARRAVTLAITLTSLLAVHAMVAYWLKAIPYDRTTFHVYLESFRTW